MLKNVILYRIAADWQMPIALAIEEALGAARFAHCGPTQTESFGWVEPRGEKHAALIEKVGKHYVVALRTENRSVPASAVKEMLEVRVAKILEETGRKPGTKQKKEIKEEITLELLPRAFTKTSITKVWINLEAKLLVVGAGSVSKADKITSSLIHSFSEAGNGISLHLIGTNTSPSAAMSAWLLNQEAPYNFSVDRECELKLPDSERSAVRYSRHALEIDEVVEHVRAGKVATQLAMTWNGRVSFVLTETMLVKKIEFLDVVMDSKAKGVDGGFEADVAIATGELSLLIPDLLEALGGEMASTGLGEPAAVAKSEPVDAGRAPAEPVAEEVGA